MKMQYRLPLLFGITTVVAIAAAAMGHLGFEKGVLLLFLVIADVVSVVRFYSFLNDGEPDIAWTAFTAAVTFPLTIVLVVGEWL